MIFRLLSLSVLPCLCRALRCALHLIGQSDSIRTIGIPGTAPPAKHGVLLLPLPSAHISCSLYIDIGLFAISSLLIASIVLIYNPFPRSPIPSPSHATGHGIYTPFGVCCGFGQAFRGPVRPCAGFLQHFNRLAAGAFVSPEIDTSYCLHHIHAESNRAPFAPALCH